MPLLAQVLGLLFSVAVINLVGLWFLCRCHESKQTPVVTKLLVTAVTSFLLFILLCNWPNVFTAINLPTELGLTLTMVALMTCIVSALAVLFLDRKSLLRITSDS